ncbi:hypothetical protein BDW74DRAFT_187858 [Aspergillus multicolor]|uniref:glutathione S-transferase family protein n=1 Tax=Aspergillus multicolor TaxID=41759 RepID=UPI003CCE1CBC
MTATDPVHFFDLYSDLSGPQKSWSPNTLKVRAVLNFKKIPYTQSWMSYPDVKPLITGLGLPPNTEGLPYTLPAIIHKASVASNPNGAMMDSFPIIQHLDKHFPGPSVFPSGDASFALVLAVEKILGLMWPVFRSLVVPRVPGHLDPRGKEYFDETRAQWFGKPLGEVRPTEQEKIDELWKLAETESAVLVRMLKGCEGKKGPFFEGEQAGYADLLVACFLAFVERFDKELFGHFMGLGEGVFKSLYEGCLPWLEGQGIDKEWPAPASLS